MIDLIGTSSNKIKLQAIRHTALRMIFVGAALAVTLYSFTLQSGTPGADL
jgi:hypothetical protein